jgi:hypothetical protein
MTLTLAACNRCRKCCVECMKTGADQLKQTLRYSTELRTAAADPALREDAMAPKPCSNSSAPARFEIAARSATAGQPRYSHTAGITARHRPAAR